MVDLQCRGSQPLQQIIPVAIERFSDLPQHHQRRMSRATLQFLDVPGMNIGTLGELFLGQRLC